MNKITEQLLKQKKEVFECPYCKTIFSQYVTTYGGGTDQIGRRINKITSQVKCTGCGHFLKSR